MTWHRNCPLEDSIPAAHGGIMLDTKFCSASQICANSATDIVQCWSFLILMTLALLQVEMGGEKVEICLYWWPTTLRGRSTRPSAPPACCATESLSGLRVALRLFIAILLWTGIANYREWRRLLSHYLACLL